MKRYFIKILILSRKNCLNLMSFQISLVVDFVELDNPKIFGVTRITVL